ncbi:A24 family peptidase [uncultured Tateyamaria sp.]|uniref:prepilin peptidase n=1 Tax=uncultured Tateyamaria sp. TaxID=455651 RepID=UPI00261945C7|nr:A24 family peptidase [uncultured Tateyamaria sp.]
MTGLEQISSTEWLSSLLLGGVLAWVCVFDLRYFQIPDIASLGLVGAGLILSIWSSLIVPTDALLGATVGYGVFAALGALFYWHTGQDGLGLGDAKLLAAAGAWLGLGDLPVLVAIAAISALSYALLTRQRRIAFGPWLAGAFWIIWMVRISA